MRAAWYDSYGPPESVEVREMPDPTPKVGEVVVRVRAASVNPLDMYFMSGTPLIARPAFGMFGPKQHIPGVDVAGVVESVGADVTRFQVGDEVWGSCRGAFAERVATGEKVLMHKPKNVSFEQAAAVPVAALTALQALRDHADVQPGQRVLINGASGGVGMFAVQLAQWMGAEVTGVCSGRNVDMVRSVGADHVVDYTSDDFTTLEGQFDAVLDNVGNRRFADVQRVMTKNATLVAIGAPEGGRVLGPMKGLVASKFRSPFVSQRLTSFTAAITAADLEVMRDLLEAELVVPVVDQTFPLDGVTELLQLQASGRVAGKALLIP